MDKNLQLALSSSLALGSTAVFFLTGGRQGPFLHRLGRAALRSTRALLAMLLLMLVGLGFFSAFFPQLENGREPLIEIWVVACLAGFWSILLWLTMKFFNALAASDPPWTTDDRSEFTRARR